MGYRGGHYDRNLTTTSGDVTLHTNDEVSANAILKRATKNYTVAIKPQTTD